MYQRTLGVVILFVIAYFCFAHGYEVCNGSVSIGGSTKQLPSRGYMTCCQPDLEANKDGILFNTLETFIKSGGRFIDTAQIYGVGEQVVGEAVRASGVPREEFWLLTKLNTMAWRPDLGSPAAWVAQQVDNSLDAMGVDYIDIMLLHFGPQQLELQSILVDSAQHPGSMKLSYQDHLDMWKGLVQAKRLGKVLHLGVTEHSQLEIENLMQIEAPALSTVWLHPWVPAGQKKFAKWLKKSGIVVVAYGAFLEDQPALGGSADRLALAKQVGNQYGATWGQVMIQYALQHGFAFETGMFHPEYLIEDAVCLNFTLTKQDLHVLHSQPNWKCGQPEKCGAQYFPGCTPPEGPPQHHVYSYPTDMFLCQLHVYTNLIEEVSTQSVGIKASTLLILITLFSVSLYAILWFRWRGVEAKVGLSTPFME